MYDDYEDENISIENMRSMQDLIAIVSASTNELLDGYNSYMFLYELTEDDYFKGCADLLMDELKDRKGEENA